MREIGLTKPFRVMAIFPVIVCYALAIAFVAVLSSGMGGRAMTASVFVSLILTIGLALGLCLIATPPALSLAVCFFGMRDARPFRLLYGILDAIAAVPPIVVAYLAMFAARRAGLRLTHITAAAALLMAFMPRLCTQLTDVLRAVPQQYYLSGVALGADPDHALRRIVFREARGGIVSAVLLMAVSMVNEVALLQIALGYSIGSELASAALNPPTLALLVQWGVRLGDTQTAAMAALILLVVDVALSFQTRRMMRAPG